MLPEPPLTTKVTAVGYDDFQDNNGGFSCEVQKLVGLRVSVLGLGVSGLHTLDLRPGSVRVDNRVSCLTWPNAVNQEPAIWNTGERAD